MPNYDELVWQAHFGAPTEQPAAHAALMTAAQQQGCAPASIYTIYKARANGQVAPTFTVPAMNLRGLSYLTAQAAFVAAQTTNTGLMIFELARSEMKYTDQTPLQFASSILGAALKTGWKHPIFIQADHLQPKAVSPGVIAPGENESIKQLITDAISAGFYNLDIDGSTLVNSLEKNKVEQQLPNAEYTVEMIKLIRSLQPAGMTISIGCEIGEIGTHLSNPSQLAAFMHSLKLQLGDDVTGPIKVAIETGTKHGGNVNPDGTAGEMTVNFDMLQRLSRIARQHYHLAGAVQHGASTLNKQLFARFPTAETLEIHLSTGFQNAILDHSAFPAELKQKMYAWCDENCKAERKSDWTDAQFYARTRKKAWGAFKKETWELSEEAVVPIFETLKNDCQKYFESLGVANTFTLLSR